MTGEITKDNLLECLIEVLEPTEEQCKDCDGSGTQTYIKKKKGYPPEERTRDCICFGRIIETTSYEQDRFAEIIRGLV